MRGEKLRYRENRSHKERKQKLIKVMTTAKHG